MSGWEEVTRTWLPFIEELLTFIAVPLVSYLVDPVEVPDYYEVIANPMDLETMRSRVDAGQYVTVPEFMDDIELILDNAKQYNPQGNSDQRGRAIVSAAHNMIDHVHSMLHRFKRNIGYNLFKRYAPITSILSEAHVPCQRSVVPRI